MSDIPGNVENVRTLLNHPAFDLRNPNKVYSLIGGFCGSPVNFHAKDGSGYRLLGEIVLQLDKLNPQVLYRSLLILCSCHYLNFFLYMIVLSFILLFNIVFCSDCRWHPAWFQPSQGGGVMMKPGKITPRYNFAILEHNWSFKYQDIPFTSEHNLH